jgi:hypothetical protein
MPRNNSKDRRPERRKNAARNIQRRADVLLDNGQIDSTEQEARYQEAARLEDMR